MEEYHHFIENVDRACLSFSHCFDNQHLLEIWNHIKKKLIQIVHHDRLKLLIIHHTNAFLSLFMTTISKTLWSFWYNFYDILRLTMNGHVHSHIIIYNTVGQISSQYSCFTSLLFSYFFVPIFRFLLLVSCINCHPAYCFRTEI